MTGFLKRHSKDFVSEGEQQVHHISDELVVDLHSKIRYPTPSPVVNMPD